MALADSFEPAVQALSDTILLEALMMTGSDGSLTPQERSARAAEKIAALGEMTGGIVHDFRNILSTIEAALSQAEHHLADPTQLSFCLAAMHEGVERGLKMTSRLLAFTKRREVEPGAEDVNELLRKLETLLRFGAGPGISFQLQLAAELPNCRVDPGQFNAAILNLVINARDAMPGGGIMEISTTAVMGSLGTDYAQDHVRVRVRDNGLGMSPETRQNIFEPYFTTKGETGTGLGVPQVHSLMDLVGGYISIESSVGAGTSFDLFFPVPEGSPKPGTTLWRQVDRWVNEGGALGDRMPASAVQKGSGTRTTLSRGVQ
ncbi:MAG: ATP-binding protein [Sphingomonas sp.]